MFDRFKLASNGEALEEVGLREMSRYLEVLEQRILSDKPYVCGDEPCIADYYIATILAQIEWLGFDLKLWPGVIKWSKAIAEKDFWKKTHKDHDEFIKSL